MYDSNHLTSIGIKLASPEVIKGWSHGEVKKPETINYRTQKPETDGLFCEKIFGPTKSWECHCGKYKKIRYKGMICDRCGVEVTKNTVRRERMGHIELAAPVSHIWYFRGIPSRMSLLLDIPPKTLERVLYFASYIVVDPGQTDLTKCETIDEARYREYVARYGKSAFDARMGAEAVKKLLQDVDIDALAEDLTRRLVDVSQEVIIREKDCGTKKGIEIPIAIQDEEGNWRVDEFADASAYSRLLAEDVADPETGELLMNAQEALDMQAIGRLVSHGIHKVKVRSVLTCESKLGVCASCYGWSLSTNTLVDIGEAVGVVAAQSIGEPGTQLTLRSFHSGAEPRPRRRGRANRCRP